MMGYQGDSPYDKGIAAFQKEQMRLLAKDKELSHMESAQLNTLLERRRGWHERDVEVAGLKIALKEAHDRWCQVECGCGYPKCEDNRVRGVVKAAMKEE